MKPTIEENWFEKSETFKEMNRLMDIKTPSWPR